MDWARINPFAKADRGQFTQDTPNKQAPTSTVVPDNKQGAQPDDKGHDPLLDFESLWQPNVDKDGKPVQPQGPRPYVPQIDQQKFGEMVGKIDFTKGITADELNAIKNGGDEGVSALMGIVNKTSRNAFQMNFSAMNKLMEQTVASARERFFEEIPGHIRNQLTDDALQTSNPLAKNPAFAPVIKNVKDAYLNKFPKATPTEVNNAVSKYLDKLHSELTNSKKANEPGPADTNASKLRSGSADADFSEWLGVEMKSATASGEPAPEPAQS